MKKRFLRKWPLTTKYWIRAAAEWPVHFGFESDKYDLSVKIGERVLLAAVRRAAPSTLVVADGFSKQQIAQLTRRDALHPAEVLALAMRNPDIAHLDFPEKQIVSARKKAQEKSMLNAGLVCGRGARGGLAFGLRPKGNVDTP